MSLKVTYKGTLDTYKYCLPKRTEYADVVSALSSKTGLPKNSIVLYYAPDRVLDEGRIANLLVPVNQDTPIYENLIMKVRPIGRGPHAYHKLHLGVQGWVQARVSSCGYIPHYYCCEYTTQRARGLLLV